MNMVVHEPTIKKPTNPEWTLRLSNIDCLDKINAKVILLISYTSTRN